MTKFIQPSFSASLLSLLNPIFHTDSYKVSHKAMEVEATQLIYSNLTPRTANYFKKDYPNFDGKVVVFGIQVFLLQELVHNWKVGFFDRDHEEVMNEIEEIFAPYIGMDRTRLEHFSQLHKLQYLPLHVKALDEGTLVPVGIPIMTIVNTHPDFSWLTNYIESVLSAEVWKPITIATAAREFAKLRDLWWDKTVVDHTYKTFAIHDFSYRGHSSHASSAVCGAAALLFSSGTDNIPGLVLARKLYSADNQVAFSVAASEHSVTTLGINFFSSQAVEDIKLIAMAKQLKDALVALGAEDEYKQALGELVTLYRLITQVYPVGVLSYVADSYDFWRVLTVILPILKDTILARTEGKLVIRPDSGDPVQMVIGNPDASTEHERKGSIQVLAEIFGSTTNSKGYKELPSQIGLIYGDGITYKRASDIFEGLAANGYAASTVVLGVGSYSFAGGTRDSLGMAVKATAAMVDDQPVAIYKDPKTDNGSKKSAKGFLVVEHDNKGEIVLRDQVEIIDENEGLLRTVFLNGVTPYLQTFQEVRELAHKG